MSVSNALSADTRMMGAWRAASDPYNPGVPNPTMYLVTFQVKCRPVRT